MVPEGSLPCSQQRAIDPMLTQMHSVYNVPPYFRKVHSNIFPSTPRSSEWPFLFTIPAKILCAFLISPCVLHLPHTSSSLI